MRDFLMLGTNDWGVALALWGNILGVIGCAVYGIRNWNHREESLIDSETGAPIE